MIYFTSIKNNFERTITCISAGKVFNVTGLRVGWAIAPSNIIKHLLNTYFLSLEFTSAFEQLVIAKDLEDSFKEYNGYDNYWIFLEYDTINRYKIFKDMIEKLNIKVIKPLGTYYCNIDISFFRNKIPQKYYYRIDQPNIYSPELNKAFCRMLIDKEKIGLIPLSEIQQENLKIDYLVRVTINRNELDFEIIYNSLKNFIENNNIKYLQYK
jgi:aspartate/methionine/tyrosine aminotransferase